jgi:hypothetical protein
MNAYEKYYRRSHNAISKLITAYQNGYKKDVMWNFRENLLDDLKTKEKVIIEEQSSILYSILIATLGLNKEGIERTEKIMDYKNLHSAGLRTMSLPLSYKNRLEQFDSQRVRKTDLDDWLSIMMDIPSDKTNMDHLRRIRNGLLHSNFYIEEDFPVLNIAHIKTKNYYEAEILEPEFSTFIFHYFSNFEGMGIVENLALYEFPKMDSSIKNQNQLETILKDLNIIFIIYDNLIDMKEKTPELILVELAKKSGNVDMHKFAKQLMKIDNFINLEVQEKNLGDFDSILKDVINYVEKQYGEKFYELTEKSQKEIIMGYLDFIINPKKGVSVWLIKFWYFYFHLFNHKQTIDNVMYKAEFSNDLLPALLILKSYSIIYRLQNNNFEEIDYSKINFDFGTTGIKFESQGNASDNCNVDYFLESFNKLNNKENYTEQEIWNKVICEVFRNSLAHGNVRPYIDIEENKYYIEFKDVNKKQGTARVISLSLDKLKRFLDSEAFLPRNCILKNENNKILSKKMY